MKEKVEVIAGLELDKFDDGGGIWHVFIEKWMSEAAAVV